MSKLSEVNTGVPGICAAMSRQATASSRSIATKRDRKSTRLNSSHGYISYAVFCLKNKILRLFRPRQRLIFTNLPSIPIRHVHIELCDTFLSVPARNRYAPRRGGLAPYSDQFQLHH